MEDWQKSLDRYLTAEPEDRNSKCSCAECGTGLYPDDPYYTIDGDIYCEDCAREWLDSVKGYVDENMAYD